jgi:hypothetical protein
MTTTLVNRKTIRGELVTLFANTGEWKAVYGSIARAELIDGQSPTLFIAGGGTNQIFAGDDFNPSNFIYIFESYVLLDDGLDWDAADAEDRFDDLDLVVRQTLRNSIGQVSFANDFEMLGNSNTGYAEVKQTYRVEQWTVVAKMYDGSA